MGLLSPGEKHSLPALSLHSPEVVLATLEEMYGKAVWQGTRSEFWFVSDRNTTQPPIGMKRDLLAHRIHGSNPQEWPREQLL